MKHYTFKVKDKRVRFAILQLVLDFNVDTFAQKQPQNSSANIKIKSLPKFLYYVYNLAALLCVRHIRCFQTGRKYFFMITTFGSVLQ